MNPEHRDARYSTTQSVSTRPGPLLPLRGPRGGLGSPLWGPPPCWPRNGRPKRAPVQSPRQIYFRAEDSEVITAGLVARGTPFTLVTDSTTRILGCKGSFSRPGPGVLAPTGKPSGKGS